MTEKKSIWLTFRLAILLSILIPLAVFGYYRNLHLSSMSKIRTALEMGDDRVAIKELKKLDVRFGLTPETCFLRARAYRHLGDDIAFAQFCELAKQLGYPQERIQIEKLLRQSQIGDVEDIDSAFQDAITSDNVELSEVGPAIVYGLLGQRKFKEVNGLLNFWSTQDPATPWIPLFRAMLAYSGHDYSTAQSYLEASLKSAPNFVPSYRQLGMCYQETQQYEKAVGAFKRYLKSYPESLEVVVGLGNVLTELDRGDEVAELFQPFFDANTASIDMKLVLARNFMSKNEPKKVIETLGSSANLWPEDVPIANLMSQANQALGNDEAAERFALVAKTGQADIQSVDGRIAQLMSGREVAVEKMYELGHILLHKQSRDDGVHWLNSALTIDQNYLPAHEDMVVYYSRMNQQEFADRHQRFIKLRRGDQ